VVLLVVGGILALVLTRKKGDPVMRTLSLAGFSDLHILPMYDMHANNTCHCQ
jgi:hypothetical protein